jgi:hypothetical protein
MRPHPLCSRTGFTERARAGDDPLVSDGNGPELRPSVPGRIGEDIAGESSLGKTVRTARHAHRIEQRR